MALVEFTVKEESPSVVEFLLLRKKIGWGDTDANMALTSLQNSLFHVLVRKNSELIGMGRVIGDGAMFFYVQDVVVDPEYQKQGVGHIIMENIESYLSSTAKKGATIGLLAAYNKEKFYMRYGYIGRCGKKLGLGMCKFL